MKKSVIFDVVFIILLAIMLGSLILLGKADTSMQYMFIPLLATYYIGWYVTVLTNKKKA
jgi:hypothetical protein